MSETLKNGLLVFIAGLLVVNTVLIITNDSGEYYDPTGAKASFERAADATEARNNALAQAASVDPLKTTAKEQNKPVTVIEFAETDHDFGTIKQDTENKKIFTFTNAGTEPLIIENAKGSCGCTVPKYPKEPIPPGGTGEIEVVYKPGKQKNAQTKNVTITANTVPDKTILTIRADVQEV